MLKSHFESWKLAWITCVDTIKSRSSQEAQAPYADSDDGTNPLSKSWHESFSSSDPWKALSGEEHDKEEKLRHFISDNK